MGSLQWLIVATSVLALGEHSAALAQALTADSVKAGSHKECTLAGDKVVHGKQMVSSRPSQNACEVLAEHRCIIAVSAGLGEFGSAVARGIRRDAGKTASIRIVGESELHRTDKLGANVIVVTRLGATALCRRLFEVSSAKDGYGLIMAMPSPWDAERHVVVLAGFDDAGLAAASSVFREMQFDVVLELQDRPLIVSARERDDKRQSERIGVSPAQLHELDHMISTWVQARGVLVPPDQDLLRRWAYQRGSGDRREMLTASSTFRQPPVRVTLVMTGQRFNIESGVIVLEDGSTIPLSERQEEP